MTDNGVHVGDVGTVLVLTVTENGAIVDLSSAVSLSLKFKAPDASVVTVTGTLNTDGTDGKIKYTHVTGDGLFGIGGKWQAQAVMQWQPSGVLKTYNSSTFEFTVYENITG